MHDHFLPRTILLVPLLLSPAALADDAPTPGRDQGVALCVEAKELSFQCKDELADHFAAMAPADRRERVRAKAVQEIIDEGSGPLEPRRARCGADYDRRVRMGRLTPADLAAMKDCASKQPECKARVACWMALAGGKK